MQKLHNHQSVIASSHPQPEDVRVSIPPQLAGKYRSQLTQDAQSHHTAAPLGKSGDSKSGSKSGVQTTAQPHPSSFNNYSEAQTLPLSNHVLLFFTCCVIYRPIRFIFLDLLIMHSTI